MRPSTFTCSNAAILQLVLKQARIEPDHLKWRHAINKAVSRFLPNPLDGLEVERRLTRFFDIAQCAHGPSPRSEEQRHPPFAVGLAFGNVALCISGQSGSLSTLGTR
jgi:hypothetical protein